MHETLTFCDLIDAGNAQSQLVLYAIARNSDWQSGSCWADQATLAKMSKCTDRTVRTHLQKLEKDGIISREERRSEHGGRLPDRITLVGYAEWIKTLREGGRVEKPKEVARYTLAENISPPPLEEFSPPPGRQVSANIGLKTNKIIKEEISVSKEDSKYNLDQLQTQLTDAAGECLDNPVNCVGLLNLSIPLLWLEQGCDLEKDILPTLKAVSAKYKGKRIRSWEYFTNAVADTKKRRETAVETLSAAAETKTTHKLNWVRIEAGTPEYEAWKNFYREKNNSLAAFMEKTKQAIFVVGKEPSVHGDHQLAYLEQQQQRDTRHDDIVDGRKNQTTNRASR